MGLRTIERLATLADAGANSGSLIVRAISVMLIAFFITVVAALILFGVGVYFGVGRVPGWLAAGFVYLLGSLPFIAAVVAGVVTVRRALRMPSRR
jgi:hypothetical protein